MNKKEHISGEVGKTLHSLDGISRAEANPFIYTRIKARMMRETGGWERIVSFVTRPAVALAVLTIIFVVNGWFVIQSQNQPADSDTINAMAAYDVSGEYNLTTGVNYELENNFNE